ncbi:DUF1684 domain-containing protein [Hymenobacter glacieicola]|uniref:DUF1684 domain-containing protein n=1 Tax=Hymenobacter glacieicola TaxID=1562124 RepID=A0ABQ1WTT6_9BACT|nr:DUF1684 domain-containing protein [Hymenobacter glacieicola]GGG45434.1 hypothetical protein GCM10011378_22070 [Hymenobacter glacieicola]
MNTTHWLLALPLALGAAMGAAQSTTPAGRPSVAEHSQQVFAFQQKLNAEYRNPAESPLPAEAQKSFTGLPFYPVNYAACVEARFEADSLGAPFQMVTSTARRPQYRKYGVLHFAFEGKPQQLVVYQSLDLQRNPEYRDYLFVPFTDRTNGHGSYGGGRYLDLRRGQIRQGKIVLDFNQAYNPYCAYGGQYSCPVPPAENRLQIAVQAGVMSDH